MNICPKKSETVYPPICGILKLSVRLNQKIVKLPIKIFKQSQNGGISFQAKLKNNINSHPKVKKGIKRGPNLRKKATLTRQEGYILQFRFFPKLLAKCLHVKTEHPNLHVIMTQHNQICNKRVKYVQKPKVISNYQTKYTV